MRPLSIVVREDSVAPLDRWLATEASSALGRPVPRGLTRKAILAGFVSVGGRIVRDPDFLPRRGPSVFVRNFDWLPQPPDTPLQPRVVFEDPWLLALDKPAGLPTHETKDPARPSLTEWAARHLGRRVFVHHRLDAATSGLVLFAKAPEANAALTEAFSSHGIKKTYVALIRRPPLDWPASLTLDSPISVSSSGAVSVGSDGVAALTRIRVIGKGREALLVEAQPVTGRKHQIRVHLAAAGAPVLGDMRYGGPPARAKRLMLHAERLALDHPVTGEPLFIESPRPQSFALSAAESGRPRAAGPPPETSALVPRRASSRRSATESRTTGKPRKRGRGAKPDSRH